jgi:hypothetical protein
VLEPRPTEIGDPNYDDPSLALLLSQLKIKTLQTAQGTSEISGQTEFNFVLQTARVFVRMGATRTHPLRAIQLNLCLQAAMHSLWIWFARGRSSGRQSRLQTSCRS